MRSQRANRVLDYCALCPRTCPFSKYVVCLHAVFKTCNEALLCRLLITCQQEGKLVEAVQVLVKATAEVVGCRVMIRFLPANEIFIETVGHNYWLQFTNLPLGPPFDVGDSLEGKEIATHHPSDAGLTAVAMRMNKLSSSRQVEFIFQRATPHIRPAAHIAVGRVIKLGRRKDWTQKSTSKSSTNRRS